MTYIRNGFLCLFTTIIFLPLPARAPVKKKILFFGDSITYAGDLPGGYIKMMRATLEQAGRGDVYELVGKGIGGNKVRDLLTRFETDVIDQKPDLVFIMVGINDVGFFHWHPEIGGTLPDQYELALTYMAKRIEEKNGQVVLCTPTVIEEKYDGTNPFDKELDHYAAIVKKVAKNTHSSFCNMRKVFIDTLKVINRDNQPKDVLTVDHVHMNEKGNTLIANTLLKYLK